MQSNVRRMPWFQGLATSLVALAAALPCAARADASLKTMSPMGEVALASGFGSVRRFNETFQQLFGRPPSALRRAGGETVSSGPAGEVSGRQRRQGRKPASCAAAAEG